MTRRRDLLRCAASGWEHYRAHNRKFLRLESLGVLANFQYQILKRISPQEPAICTGSAYFNKSKIEALLGRRFLDQIVGRTIIDFGCGEGDAAIEMAQRGAGFVVGLDIQSHFLEAARQHALRAGVATRCCFASSTTELADFIVSLDGFEHFADPGAVLRQMDTLLRPTGEVAVAFGPTWYHPLGGHLFSIFPWGHLVFSEDALIRWRAGFRSDGATKFSETAGGLNRMTIRSFERLVAASPLRFEWLELVPIRKLRALHNGLTREFTTAVVRCRLVKRASFRAEKPPR